MAGCSDGSFAVSRLMKPTAAASAAQLKSSQATAIRDRRSRRSAQCAAHQSGSGPEAKIVVALGRSAVEVRPDVPRSRSDDANGPSEKVATHLIEVRLIR